MVLPFCNNIVVTYYYIKINIAKTILELYTLIIC